MSGPEELTRHVPALDTLEEPARSEAARLIGEARAAQREALAGSMEEALRFVPALLRGQVRRMLLP